MTRQSEHARNFILQTLSDGNFHSGEALGASLNISRAAVSKHIKVLASLGLDIFSVTGRGYKLASSLDLLNASRISDISTTVNHDKLTVLNVTDSTNVYVKKNLNQMTSGDVCLAEAQTAGRGRHGRTWVSPYGAALYLSMYWRFDGGHQALSGLSLAIGVAIARTLKALDINDVNLKWPNDVYVSGRKIAGVLIEVEGQMGSACDAVIGIGLNMSLPSNITGIDQPFTDLQNALENVPSRNHVAALLIDNLNTVLDMFSQHGLAGFVGEWQMLDIFSGEQVKLLIGEKEVHGMCAGINDSGALLLDLGGKLEAFYGGEISVRAV
ncbi:bifunctional biotin--[acetyl-CoA-carboxylase] ligase/biotin operon repressor BirA [Aestuariibacter sp. AA17]|uniref:Bifunctional ligase/repressor BirA n=1 Tax=Fluctibacter corallii TaxID=2984329 RepID=A0ABT3ADC2_9ALTE|nr:bifunctional biotin--[acetyl-CoA-carboxylase] ligase/biotin operon repressor BirA [Aestuariibacter sp. AA17]MCV2886677.1 bifunctional biotin--[acetyl-CoA-carboxylase] ligase/biotin operon repressor BirA [Aestuariibacter sp. AA17]